MGGFFLFGISWLYLRGHSSNECADDRRAVVVPDGHARSVRIAILHRRLHARLDDDPDDRGAVSVPCADRSADDRRAVSVPDDHARTVPLASADDGVCDR